MNGWLRNLLPRRIGPRRILRGPLKGQKLVTSWHDYPAGIVGRTESALLAWFERNVTAGQTWLDIGGHYGYTALALSRLVGANGRVFTFEPVVATAGCVAQTRSLNNLGQLTVLPFGLGSPDAFESIDLPLVRGMADRTLAGTSAATRWRETIQVARFDWLWPRINAGRHTIDGVKIDVQGMELEVLRGMQEALTQFRPKLVVEFHRGVDRAPIFDLLTGSGYQRDVMPIEPQPPGSRSEVAVLDDRSYAFARA